MIKIELKGIDGVQRKLDAIREGLRGQAMQMAINKTAQKAQAEITRAIRDEYQVKADEVRNAISLRRASRGQLEAVIQVFGSKSKRGRSMNLIHFVEKTVTLAAARKRMKAGEGGIQVLRSGGQVRKALEVRFGIKKGGGLKTIKGAFIANKGRTVFVRTGNARLPIEPLQVIGFSQMFSSHKIRDRVMAKIREDLPVEVDRAIKAILARQA